VRCGALQDILAPRPQVSIIAGPLPADLAAHLATLAPGTDVTEGQVILSGEAVALKTQVLRLLLDAGVDIRQLDERHATLEEVYLEATGG
jgi:hypothetical protein